MDTNVKTEPKAPSQTERKSLFGDGPVGGESRGGGEGMDRKVKQSKFPPKRIALIAAIVAFLGLVGYLYTTTTGGKKLNVEREKLTIAPVEYGSFQEYMAVTGNVQPIETIYLDAEDGGQVEEIFVQEGALVTEGQPILRFSNNDLFLRVMNLESSRIEQRNRLDNTRFQMEQNALSLRQQLTDMDYQITRLGREFQRQKELHDKNLISDQEFEQTRDEYEYQQRRRALTLQGYQADSLRSIAQIRQMEDAIQRLDTNFNIAQQSLENLTVRAPVTGQLSALNVELGEIHSRGSRLGQIDVLDGFKVRAQIDEFYIARVQRGQTARGEVAGQSYEMTVKRVYPEVRDGRFEVDLEFVGDPPTGIRRGQTLRFRLEMSDPTEATLVPRGGFFQTTGGNWVYVVQGDEAVKRNIHIGRQNTDYYEVLDGLKEGEQVVVSSYDTFGDADRLVLK